MARISKKKQQQHKQKRSFYERTSTAPIVPSKRNDKLGTGFQTMEEERLHEIQIRKENGQLPIGSGYTHFQKKIKSNKEMEKDKDQAVFQLSKFEPRIRPDHQLYFMALNEFTGWKEDYLFMTRHRGVGYYWVG